MPTKFKSVSDSFKSWIYSKYTEVSYALSMCCLPKFKFAWACVTLNIFGAIIKATDHRY